MSPKIRWPKAESARKDAEAKPRTTSVPVARKRCSIAHLLDGKLIQAKGKNRVAGRNGYPLLALTQIADGSRGYKSTGIGAPQFLSHFGIQSVDLSLIDAAEDQVARGGEQTRLRHAVQLVLPPDLARGRIDRFD